MNSTSIMSDDDVAPADVSAQLADADGGPPEREATERERRFAIRWTVGHPDGIVTGLSAVLAERLAVDPLWVRLAFVGSALFGGLGVFVYFGLWLALIVARSTTLRVAGAAVIVGSFLVLADSDIGFSTGPVAVIGLLAGLALALWKPVPTWVGGNETLADGVGGEGGVGSGGGAGSADGTSNSWSVPAGPAVDGSGSDQHTSGTSDRGGTAVDPTDVREGRSVTRQARSRRFRPTVVERKRRPQRPPSVLGRSTLGVALIVGAAGALTDELNGGRLHPEQWLGAAAIVCGLGLLVGTVRGHARWLIVPAIAFAGVGYGGGLLARIGVQPSDALSSSFVWVGENSTGPYQVYTGFGSADVQVTEVLSSPVTVDARTAAGMTLSWDRDVAVEIRSRLGDVTMNLNGNSTTGSTLRIGPDGAPDVIIDLRMARGTIDVIEMEMAVEELGNVAGDQPLEATGPSGRVRPDGSPIGPIVDVADGIAVTSDGWIILNSAVIIDEFNQVIVGDWFSADGESFVISSEFGDYRIVGPILFTPDGAYYDLDALRQQASEQPAPIAEQIAPPDITPTLTLAPAIVSPETTIGIDE